MGTTNQIEILNDLIQINNGRIKGYKKAIRMLNDSENDLCDIFIHLSHQSRLFCRELQEEVKKIGGNPGNTTTIAGKIFRGWMDFKATFTGTDKEAVLNNCEFGEDAARKAYAQAIESGDLNSAQRLLIRHQAELQKSAHDQIKSLRDAKQASASTVL